MDGIVYFFCAQWTLWKGGCSSFQVGSEN